MKIILAFLLIARCTLAANIPSTAGNLEKCRGIIQQCEQYCGARLPLTNICAQYRKCDQPIESTSSCVCSVFKDSGIRNLDFELGSLRSLEWMMNRPHTERFVFVQYWDYTFKGNQIGSDGAATLTSGPPTADGNIEYMSAQGEQYEWRVGQLFLPANLNISTLGIVSASAHHQEVEKVFELDFEHLVSDGQSKCRVFCEETLGRSVLSYIVSPMKRISLPFYSAASLFDDRVSVDLPLFSESCNCNFTRPASSGLHLQ